MGDLKNAYETYYAISELYDKQTPFYMLARISIERENYYKAREWVDENMMRFERGKDFWRMTAEQQVDTEWHIWKEYEKAQKTQDALLSYFPDDVRYLKNRLGLYACKAGQPWYMGRERPAHDTMKTAYPLNTTRKAASRSENM